MGTRVLQIWGQYMYPNRDLGAPEELTTDDELLESLAEAGAGVGMPFGLLV